MALECTMVWRGLTIPNAYIRLVGLHQVGKKGERVEFCAQFVGRAAPTERPIDGLGPDQVLFFYDLKSPLNLYEQAYAAIRAKFPELTKAKDV